METPTNVVKMTQAETTTQKADDFMHFGEEEATIQERVAQDVNGKNKYFFLRLSSEYSIQSIEKKIIAEQNLKGTHIKISDKWQPTIEEAIEYLTKQTSERNAFDAIKEELKPVEDTAKFAKAWIEETKDDEYKTRCFKTSINIEGSQMFAYVVASVYIAGNKKITSPSMLLICDRDMNALSASKRVSQILIERSEYANTQNELANI